MLADAPPPGDGKGRDHWNRAWYTAGYQSASSHVLLLVAIHVS